MMRKLKWIFLIAVILVSIGLLVKYMKSRRSEK